MEQHPIPQPITSYEFRLVGDMTIRQFGKLASGLILALIVYAIDPPALLKWFLIFLFAGIGAAMAFVPFEGRSVDVWIIAFFKRIYSPTQYLWKQRQKPVSGQIITPPPTSPHPPATKTVATPPQLPPTPPSEPVSPKPFPAPQTSAYSIESSHQIAEKVLKQSPNPKPVVKMAAPKFMPGLVIPATPSMPNLLVGFTRSKEEKLIDGAILEIRDATGIPVRAFKTNKLGQFQSATPLPNGSYEIETEKEGFSFDIIRIDLKGEIIPPIEIISR